MIEWINRVFKIDNDVSVPTLISLIVFITGGLASYTFIKIRESNSRKKIRKTIVALLEEVINDLKPKENHASNFYPTLKTDHQESWFFPYKQISYLQTFFQLDFNEIYSSFQKKISLSFNRKLRDRAFHRVWASLRNLQFLEEKLQKDISDLSLRFDTFHKQYNANLSNYRKHHDELIIKTNGTKLPTSEKATFDYLTALDKIWFEWQQEDEKERTSYYITYMKLVKPALELNRVNPSVLYTHDSDNILLDCTHQYIEIENLLHIYQRTFKSYYWNYRYERRLLSKCLLILK